MSNYIELVNDVLTLINEEPLNEQNFNNTRGLHSAVKLSVRNTVSRINKYYSKWPFNAAEHTMNLVPGQEEYGWPQDMDRVDWDTFYIQKDNTLNISTKKLTKVNRNDWYQKMKTTDDDQPNGVGIPSFVFDAHGRGFGVSPSPKEPYEIKFRYFLSPPVLKDALDVCTIPPDWEFVITDGALYFMKNFKENTEISMITKADFDRSLSRMRTALINNYDYMQDTMLHTKSIGGNG